MIAITSLTCFCFLAHSENSLWQHPEEVERLNKLMKEFNSRQQQCPMEVSKPKRSTPATIAAAPEKKVSPPIQPSSAQQPVRDPSKPLTTTDKERILAPYLPSPPERQGKVTLVTFWFPECGPCHAELSVLESLARKYSCLQVVPLNTRPAPSPQTQSKTLMTKLNSYSVLQSKYAKHDTENVLRSLRATGTPHGYIVDENGHILNEGDSSEILYGDRYENGQRQQYTQSLEERLKAKCTAKAD